MMSQYGCSIQFIIKCCDYIDIKKMAAAVFFIIIFTSTPALSILNCSQQPSCTELGYSTSIDSDCLEENILYCPFDTSYKKCVRQSCAKLGFTDNDKSSWCGKIIPCPENSGLTLCAESSGAICPTGYSSELKSVSNCGTSGSSGWTYESVNITSGDGSVLTCGKCAKKSCSGSLAYTSVSDCGSTGSNGWTFSTCYYGDEKLGTCTKRTCESHGYKTNSSSCTSGVYKYATATIGDLNSNCYVCGTCQSTSIAVACKLCASERVKSVIPATPTGYFGTCAKSMFVCCSVNESCTGRCPTSILDPELKL